jgi:hypothetical protein
MSLNYENITAEHYECNLHEGTCVEYQGEECPLCVVTKESDELKKENEILKRELSEYMYHNITNVDDEVST